jgi:hypothetical protein
MLQAQLAAIDDMPLAQKTKRRELQRTWLLPHEQMQQHRHAGEQQTSQ